MAGKKRRTRGEGTVYEKRPGHWAAQIRCGGERITAYGPTSDIARRHLADKLADRETRAKGASRDLTVGEYLAIWINELRATEALKPSTWRRYESTARIYLIPLIGDRRLRELSKQDVAEVIRASRTPGIIRDRHVSETTIHHVHAILRCALQAAVDQDLLDRNVAKLVRGPSMRHRPKVILDSKQASALVTAAKGEALGAAIILSIATGMREGEVLGLTRGQLDLGKCRLAVTSNAQVSYTGKRELGSPKTEAGNRVIMLPAFARDALEEHLARQSPPSVLVFPDPETGELISDSRFLRSHFHPILAKAGLPKMPFHDLRHSAATLLKERGVDDVTVSRILGHSSPVITMKLYGHVTASLEERAARAMDEVLGTGSVRRSVKAIGSQMAATSGKVSF